MSFKERRGERQEAGKSPKLSKTEEHHQQQQKGLLQSKHTHSKYAITFSPLLFSITPTTNKYLTFLLSVFLLFCFFPNVFCFLLFAFCFYQIQVPTLPSFAFAFAFAFAFCFLLLPYPTHSAVCFLLLSDPTIPLLSAFYFLFFFWLVSDPTIRLLDSYWKP